MAAANHDIKIEKGQDFVFHVVYQDENGNGIDLSSHSAYMGIKRSKYLDNYIVYFDSNPIGITLNYDGATGGSGGYSGGIRLNRNFGNTGGETGGIYAFIAGATATLGFPDQIGFYDLFINDTNGTIKLVEGRVEIIGEVSQ